VEFWKSINVTELTLKIPRGGQAAAGIGGRLGGDGDDGGGGGDGGADGGGSEGGGKYGGEGDAGGGGDNGGGGGRDIGTGGDGTGSMVAGSDAHLYALIAGVSRFESARCLLLEGVTDMRLQECTVGELARRDALAGQLTVHTVLEIGQRRCLRPGLQKSVRPAVPQWFLRK